MIDQYSELEHHEYDRLSQIYITTIKKIPEDLRLLKIDQVIAVIFDSMRKCISEQALTLQTNLLLKALNQETSKLIHISFPKILMELDDDEISILKNVHLNKYEFVETFDYTRENGFFNHHYQKFDYPKEDLIFPDKFPFYIEHLQGNLNLVNWPIYDQQPIIIEGVQTGLAKLSRLVETRYGSEFNKSIFD